MEPIHIHALLHHEVDAEVRRKQLERYFAVRAEASRNRHERRHRRRRRVAGWMAPGSTVRPAV